MSIQHLIQSGGGNVPLHPQKSVGAYMGDVTSLTWHLVGSVAGKGVLHSIGLWNNLSIHRLGIRLTVDGVVKVLGNHDTASTLDTNDDTLRWIGQGISGTDTFGSIVLNVPFKTDIKIEALHVNSSASYDNISCSFIYSLE
jgi:hypothetical protein